MPSIFTRMNQWVQKQRRTFQAQRVLGERDRYIRQQLERQDDAERRINETAALSQTEKEYELLSYRQRDAEGERGEKARMADFDYKIREAYNGATDSDEMNPRAGGLGAFLGRLVSGRRTRAALDRSDANYAHFAQTHGFIDAERQRLQELRPQVEAEREQRARQAAEAVAAQAARKADAERILGAVRDDPNINGKKQIARDTMMKMYGEVKTFGLSRQIPAFMKPGAENEAHNRTVVRVLGEQFDNKDPAYQTNAVHLLKQKLEEISQVNVESINLDDYERCKEIYPVLEQYNSELHAVMDVADVKRMDEAHVKQIFPTKEEKYVSGVKATFMMNAANQIRGRLLEEAGCDPAYLLGREHQGRTDWTSDSVRDFFVERMQRRENAAMGLNGTKTLQDFAGTPSMLNIANSHDERYDGPDPTKEAAKEAPAKEAATLTDLQADFNITAAPQTSTHKAPEKEQQALAK